jgi:hypothetical protein
MFLALVTEGASHRVIARELRLSMNNVLAIVSRHGAENGLANSVGARSAASMFQLTDLDLPNSPNGDL